MALSLLPFHRYRIDNHSSRLDSSHTHPDSNDEPTDSARFISFSTASLIDRDRFLCSRVALAAVIFDAIFFLEFHLFILSPFDDWECTKWLMDLGLIIYSASVTNR